MNATGTASNTPAGRRRWLSDPRGRVAVLGGALGAATLVALGLLARHGVTLPGATASRWYAAVLVLSFLVTEGFAVHVRARRGSHAMSTSEIPMVLALLSFDPVLVVAGRVVGGGAGLLLLRRQRGLKLGFNVVTLGMQSTVAAVTFAMLCGGDHLGVRLWVATYAAILLSDAAALVAVTAVIAVHDDPGEWAHLPRAIRGVPLVAIATTIALVSSLAVEHNQWVMLLLVAVSVILFLAYRAFVQQSEGHAQVRELYAFTQALDGSSDIQEITRIVLEQTRDQLRAETAELIVPAVDGKPASRTRISGAEAMTATVLVLDRDPEAGNAWWAPALSGQAVLLRAGDTGKTGGKKTGHDKTGHDKTGTGKDGANAVRQSAELPTDGMAVPVPWGEVTAALLVRDSLADIRSFDADALRLFQALANHAGVSIANATLVDRLRREAEEKEHLALHDPMTGLPNRRHFQGLLDSALEASRHDDSGPAVIQLDLDRFKEVNDALGHETGDSVLREVGYRLQARVDGIGRLARLGGDEFAVLLPRVHSVQDALRVAADLARDLEPPVQLGPLSLSARASIGIAVAPVHGDDAQTLLRRADVAMYAAKSGHTGIRLYLPEDDQNTPHRLALIADLRTAIQQRDLLVVFQPKIDPHTGLVTGAEALARWHHPEHGNIPPDQFVPLAEHAGLVRQLTVHVLEVALRRCAAWRRAGHDLHVAVNLSASSLHDPTIPDMVSRLLAQTGVPACALTLEITESSLMEDQPGSLATLRELNERGVKLSIDDFGTGYSSLGRLRHLPIHEVKIDKSFVQRVAVDHRDRAVVRSAVQLGHALNLDVVAEGVEDQETYAYLCREGCNVVQGYLISRPLPPDAFMSWLTSHNASNVIHFRFTA